jgi:outer membrane protein insertion porin family
LDRSPTRRVPQLILLLALSGWYLVAAAQSPNFVVRDMRVEGLQRIAEGTVYNYLPISIGDTVDPVRIKEAVRAVYGTGLFSDIEFRREGSTLIIAVRERPSIKSFTISGNKDIETEQLEESLQDVGLAAGRTFDRSVLENVTQFLTDQYYARGKYNVIVDTDVEELPDNTVEIAINITEGRRAKIRQINIVGNEAFSDEELLKAFKLRTPNMLCFYRQDCHYGRDELAGDIESLESYYLDRGYATFEVESTQVAISPDRQSIYITINVEEGEPFVISDVKLAGDLVVPEAQLQRLVLAKPGQTFSQRALTQTSDLISYRLGEDGYAFARVEPVPEINEETAEVALTFYVQPGKRAYVRRISFAGTTAIQDRVLRREMRQMEGAFLSNRAVERSEQRVRRLPFVESVEVDTTPVVGSDDLVDVDFEVEDGQPGSFGGGLGYSGGQGIILNGNFVHTNFMGTGNRIEADINTSDFVTVYRAVYTNPYVTPNAVSRTVSLSYRDVTQFTNGASEIDTKTWTLGLEYGYPISEYSRLRFGVAFQDAEIVVNTNSSFQQYAWVSQNGNPTEEIIETPGGEIVFGKTDFRSYELLGGWTYDSRNRALFADRGARQRLALSSTGPGSEVEYYTARYDWVKYWPLAGPWGFRWAGEVNWADNFGDTTSVPPFKRYFGGGPNSVRGYKEGRLGPYDSLGNPYGGNLAMASQFELLLPVPEQFTGKTRASLFFDAGNVFSTDDTLYPVGLVPGCVPSEFDFVTLFTECGIFEDYDFDVSDLRYSVGAAVEWLSPMGVFKFSYGIPLNDKDRDEVEEFQFSIGSAF